MLTAVPTARRRVAIALAFVALTIAAATTRADVDPMPRTFVQAVKMEQADSLPRTRFFDAPSLVHGQPGDLLRLQPFDGYVLPAGIRAVRILYQSLDAADQPVATSAVILLPSGKVPAGGWPVIAWAHGTSGVARQCAPSLMKDFEYGEEGLYPMVRAGFAVVATDYHGLGTAGTHQYVNKRAQAHDVIFSIAAARLAAPSLAARWVVVGHSQGGLAAWGVAELEHDIKDAHYLGAVAVAPGINIEGILRRMSDPSSDAAFYLAYMTFGIRALAPEFRPSRMLTGRALRRYVDVTTRGCWNYAYGISIGHEHEPAAVTGWAEQEPARRFFRAAEVGQTPIGGPLFVIAGEADGTVPIDHVRTSVEAACRKGIALEFRSYPGLDHDPTMDVSTPDILAWTRDRFAGKPATNSCGTVAVDGSH